MRQGRKKLDESDFDSEKGNVAVCQCGLSEEFPFCDGSHRAARTETEGVCYRYLDENDEVRRREVERIVEANTETVEPDEKPIDDSR
ncbi:MAG: CDGSH iron-sulfur domain-containing protein [Halovenus sp.]